MSFNLETLLTFCWDDNSYKPPLYKVDHTLTKPISRGDRDQCVAEAQSLRSHNQIVRKHCFLIIAVPQSKLLPLFFFIDTLTEWKSSVKVKPRAKLTTETVDAHFKCSTTGSFTNWVFRLQYKGLCSQLSCCPSTSGQGTRTLGLVRAPIPISLKYINPLSLLESFDKRAVRAKVLLRQGTLVCTSEISF